MQTLLVSDDLESLAVGMEVSLIIEPLFEDEEGREVVTYKFKLTG